MCQLNAIILYLETRKLPAGEKEARELVLGQSQFTVKDGVFYRVLPDSINQALNEEALVGYNWLWQALGNL